MAFQLHHLHPAISRGGLAGALKTRLGGRERLDAPQPLQAGGYVCVSCVKNKVDTLESLRDLSRWLRARRWDVGIRDQTNFHDTFQMPRADRITPVHRLQAMRATALRH